jgi:hypothetical protein
LVRMGLEMVLGFGFQRSQPGECADSPPLKQTFQNEVVLRVCR